MHIYIRDHCASWGSSPITPDLYYLLLATFYVKILSNFLRSYYNLNWVFSHTLVTKSRAVNVFCLIGFMSGYQIIHSYWKPDIFWINSNLIGNYASTIQKRKRDKFLPIAICQYATGYTGIDKLVCFLD